MEVRAEGVSKVIGPATLLAPVSLHVPAGTCLVVRGPNGSGKTTLLRTLLVGGMLWGAPRFASNGWFVITTWVVAVCVVYAGLSRVRSESLAHRDV